MKFETWLSEVRAALKSINMAFEDWQPSWHFDFEQEYKAGIDPAATAAKANRFWWREQNRSIDRDCRKTSNCWLPRNHHGECEPTT